LQGLNFGKAQELYYQQLDALRSLRREVHRDLLAERKKHKVWNAASRDPVDRSDPSGTSVTPITGSSGSNRLSRRAWIDLG